MGCASTTGQLETIVEPSVNYIEPEPKKEE